MSLKMTRLHRVPKINQNMKLLRLVANLRTHLYHITIPIKVLRIKSRWWVQPLKSRDKKSKSSLSSTKSRSLRVNRKFWSRSISIRSRNSRVTRKSWSSLSLIRNRSLKAIKRCKKSSRQLKLQWACRTSKILSKNRWFSNWNKTRLNYKWK